MKSMLTQESHVTVSSKTTKSQVSNLAYTLHLTRVFTGLLLVSLIFAALMTGCGAPKKSGEGNYKSCVPGKLQYLPRDNGVFLQWRPNCGSNGSQRGYNFYIVADSELTSDFPKKFSKANGFESHTGAAYPGDTNPDNTIETAELHSLLNGVPYSAIVRNILSDGSESKPSNVIHFTPMPGGEFALHVRYSGENDGFDFASGQPERADNARNDLYLAKSSKGAIIASPSKLSFGLKSTRFQKVGNFKSLLDAAGEKSSGAKTDEIKVKVGDVFDALTENNHYARFRVKAIADSGKDSKERVVTIEYLYQTRPQVDSF